MVPEPRRALSAAARALLRCPACRAELTWAADKAACTSVACQRRYPVVDGVPILIHEENSLFRLAEIRAERAAAQRSPAGWRRLLPGLSRDLAARENIARLVALLAERAAPRVLVVGSGLVGQGMEQLLATPGVEVIESDVRLGARVSLVCDAHDIPFADGAFDAVVAQAVLEHVVDPQRCVAEIHRVLQADGLVYAETPFMQQVHEGRYDFQRFTFLGHRRLFRRFQELASGIVCGPGMALAWAWLYWLWSWATRRRARQVLFVVAHLTGFLWKYADPFLATRPAAYDAASGVFFLGRKSAEVLSDRELLQGYRGAQ
jgi:SAM-dependent methyltransferase